MYVNVGVTDVSNADIKSDFVVFTSPQETRHVLKSVF